MLVILLILLAVLAVVCHALRKRAVRWLFSILMYLFWIAFVVLLGFTVGYQAGQHNVHLLHILRLK